VAVPVPSATAAGVDAACRALLAAVPDELDPGVRRRPVTDAPDRTAAWGDPPVTLRCGGPAGEQTATPLEVNGLKFVTTRAAGHVLWTTQDRAVNVTLDVPTSYESQADVVLPLVEPILRTLPKA
jgi:hypothetical protein